VRVNFRQGPSGIRWTAIAIAVCSLTLASSCGRPKVPEIQGKLPVFPVKGSVLVDGKPVAQAQIVFFPASPFPKDASQFLPRARTSEDGTFTVMTYADADGAPAGTYKVTVTWRGTGAEEQQRTDDDPNLIPPMYHNPRITKLRAKVEEGENTLPPFEIKLSEQQASN
jgi:hypothetical protein